MRRFKRMYIVAGMALSMAIAFASVSWATHPGHIFRASFTPTGKAKGDKPAPGALDIALIGADDPATPNPAPPAAQTIDIDLDKSIKVSTKHIPECNADLEGTPSTGPGSADELCGTGAGKKGNALLGTAAATAQIGANVYTGTGLVFNGPAGIIVHIRIEALGATAIVPVSVITSPDQSLYGQRLSAPNVPPIAGGAGALSSLDLTGLERKTVIRKRGKKKVFNLVSGKCTDGTYDFALSETYSDHEPIHETVTQPCTK
jgi:hypothetical protein